MSDAYEFRILGPLLVTNSDQHIEISGIRRRKLLATLLLQSGRLVSLDRLTDAIWDDEPPSSAHGQVRICVSGLRRLLRTRERHSLIETHPSSYRIQPRDDDALDLFTFEDLVAEGRALLRDDRLERAEQVLKSALGLWRGPVAADLDSRTLEALAVKHNDNRLTVSEEYFDVALRLGRHHQIMGDLAGFVVENPFRERAIAQLMLALFRLGRTAEALETFRAVRRRFAEDLGIEPAAELHTLHQSILAGDLTPAPAGAVTVPCPPPGRGRRSRSARLTLVKDPVHRAHRETDPLERLRRENDVLRTERDALRQVMSLWLTARPEEPGA
ncbi:hypothetical protein SRB5_01800 [Streptomyces sp. RB5]|uniref:OmpR/PhoB-type domain-containing protein n=1 Tax=Streptomyces smaragdinus TaxID=2585196 RepID=A0A7K0C9K1_9ACTN|nr:AfsR/SARP family transcriptional regulator BagI/FevR [Streptomyces smaragdinus]MQY10076.1 hypothetical protein [Streptomyces smaragdinus]